MKKELRGDAQTKKLQVSVQVLLLSFGSKHVASTAKEHVAQDAREGILAVLEIN